MAQELIATDPEFWAEMDEEHCPCKGTGWADIYTTVQPCVIHYQGQLHPMSRDLLLDEPDRLREEERKSNLKWKIVQVQQKIAEQQVLVKEAQKTLVLLELELINKTPTVKMQAVNPSDPSIEVDEVNWSGVFPAEAE